MEKINIYRKPRLRNPYLLVAWPGMGEVAFRAASYLIEKLSAQEFASIPPEDFFYLTTSVVQSGILNAPELPASRFYYWKNKSGKNDLIIFLSNAQPDLIKAEDYSRRILQLAKSLKVKSVVSFAAMPQAVDHSQDPNVWFTATSKELLNALQKMDLTVLNEGQISGMNGLFLGIAKREGFSGFCLLGEIPLYTIQIENPKASASVLEAFSRITGIEVNLDELLDQARGMEEEINKLLDYLKVGPTAAGPIGEDDIEKIKKSLSQITKLPLSVKEKVENLFAQAESDISRASELKAELDRWNVYKEYEDRFLDLFRKNKEKNN